MFSGAPSGRWGVVWLGPGASVAVRPQPQAVLAVPVGDARVAGVQKNKRTDLLRGRAVRRAGKRGTPPAAVGDSFLDSVSYRGSGSDVAQWSGGFTAMLRGLVIHRGAGIRGGET